MKEEDLRHFTDILKTFDTAMLVTQRGRELRSRPMEIVDRTEDGRVWFITSIDSAKLEELTENPDVNVTMQDDPKFLSISGAVRATRDREKVDEVWRESFDAWFPEGRDDPTVVLLEIVPTYVEYWDRSGVGVLQSIFASAAELDEDDDAAHGKVDFPKSESELPRPARH